MKSISHNKGTVFPSIRMLIGIGLPISIFAVIMLMQTPDGLTAQGQRALAIMVLAVVLWSTESLHIAVTGLISMVLLVLFQGVGDIGEALHGFSQPVCYFLLGILTLGLAVHKSGLAERMAISLIRLSGGSPRKLYFQMLVSFAVLTFALPSASTRGAILVHVYEQVLDNWQVKKSARLYKAIMIAMASLNRLGSTALLAGGITPVVAAALVVEYGNLDDFSWTGWFMLMALPFYVMLMVGGLLVFILYSSGFKQTNGVQGPDLINNPVSKQEIRIGIIVMVTALLWFTDFAHGLPPAVPALIAMIVILMPKIGLLDWRDFEQNLGWTNFFVIATSLSLANALVTSGAAGWFAELLVGGVTGLGESPFLVLLVMAVSAAIARLLMPNIAAYLALVIPIAMSTGGAMGLNPIICGLAVVIVGDSVVFYPAGGTASVFIYIRAEIRSPEVFRLGIIMTVVSIATLFCVALPYWSLLGQTLTN